MKLFLSLLFLPVSIVLAAGDEPVDFGRDILPILSDNCYQCHGPDPKNGRKGELRLDDESDGDYEDENDDKELTKEQDRDRKKKRHTDKNIKILEERGIIKKNGDIG